MRPLHRIASVAATTLLFAGVAVGAPMTAAADVRPMTAAECRQGANGFVDIPDDQSGRVVDPQHGSFTILSLQFADIQGANRGYAKLTTAAGPIFFGGGELVWMDWTQNGGANWLQCGPFTARKGTDQITSAAKNTNPSPSWQFRAGALVDGTLYLTGWH